MLVAELVSDWFLDSVKLAFSELTEKDLLCLWLEIRVCRLNLSITCLFEGITRHVLCRAVTCFVTCDQKQ